MNQLRATIRKILREQVNYNNPPELSDDQVRQITNYFIKKGEWDPSILKILAIRNQGDIDRIRKEYIQTYGLNKFKELKDNVKDNKEYTIVCDGVYRQDKVTMIVKIYDLELVLSNRQIYLAQPVEEHELDHYKLTVELLGGTYTDAVGTEHDLIEFFKNYVSPGSSHAEGMVDGLYYCARNYFNKEFENKFGMHSTNFHMTTTDHEMYDFI
jgi:hypothetical protein